MASSDATWCGALCLGQPKRRWMALAARIEGLGRTADNFVTVANLPYGMPTEFLVIL
jgi:hypothetical protein